MGRHRSTGDASLPPRLHRKGNSFYYVTSETPRRWIPLGNDLCDARMQWAQLENNVGAVHTFAGLMLEWKRVGWTDFSDGTRRTYSAWLRCLLASFPDSAVDSIKPPVIAQWRDRNAHRKPWINGCLSVGKQAYKKAMEWGWTTTNPFAAVALFPARVRTRIVSDDEFRAVRTQAPQWLQDAMDLSYLTGMRRGDVAALKWAQVGDIASVTQIKTGTRQNFIISDAARAVLERCRSGKIVGLSVIGGLKARGVTGKQIGNHMLLACRAADVEDFTFHDIRAMYAAAAKAAGLDYQAGLGHASKAMSDRYVRAKAPINAPTLMRKL